jgi:hypothetical protein
MMSAMVLQYCASQVCFFFVVDSYRQNAAASLGLFFQLGQDVPLDGDIAPQDTSNLFELAAVLSRSVYLPGWFIARQLLHIFNIETSLF